MRTRLSAWQIKAQKEQEQMKYVEASYETTTLAGNMSSSYFIPFPEGVSGMNIKSIKVSSAEFVPFIFKALEDDGSVLYESGEETKEVYDAVDIVYKTDNKGLSVVLQNRGVITTKFKVKINGIEVR